MDFDEIDLSYTKLYKNFTQLQYPPERFYYAFRSGWTDWLDITIFDVYQSFNISGLYNSKIQQDIWLLYNDVSILNYFRYVALNFGYGGLFTATSPSA